MRLAIITGKGKAEIHQHAIPEVGDCQVLVKNKVCNICTSDYQQWLGLRPHQKTPMAFGHENAGIVWQVGKKVKNVQVGDAVVTNVYGPCMECENCRKNMNSLLCLHSDLPVNRNEFGYYGPYGCSEYKLVDSRLVYKINKDIPFEHMAFCEPLATVVYGIKQLDLQPMKRVLVIGAGTMGLLNASLARLFGADVIISDISQKKLEHAKLMGFTKLVNPSTEDYLDRVDALTGGLGVETVIIAAGTSSAYKQATDLSQMGGELLLFAAGYPEPDWDLSPNLIHYKLMKVIGAYGCRPADFQEACDLLGSGEINVEKLVQASYPLAEIQKAFEEAVTEDSYRVSVLL